MAVIRGNEHYLVRKHLLELNRNFSGREPLCVDLVRFSRVNVTGDYRYPVHEHPNCELILPLSSPYQCILNGEKVTVPAGSLLFIQPQDIHQDFYQIDTELMFFIFLLSDYSANHWPEGIFAPGTKASDRIIEIAADSVLQKLIEVLDAASEEEDWSRIVCEKIGEALFWQLVSGIQQESLSEKFKLLSGQNLFRMNVETYFQNHLNGPLDMNEMSDYFRLSRRTLEYRFREAFGTSPSKAFKACRMRVAEQLLEQGITVNAVSRQLGYPDAFCFSNAYKRFSGQAPSHRKRNS